MHNRVAIAGSGAWGTALAIAVARAGRSVTLWSRDADMARHMSEQRQNLAYLPGVILPASIRITYDFKDLHDAGLLIAAVPAQSMRDLAKHLAGHIPSGIPVVVAAKGLELGSNAFMSDIIGEHLPHNPPALLSGPSFAVDVGKGLPTAVTLAARDEALARSIVELLSSPSFRLYHSTDLRGAEIGGAAKNVLAIASGICAGQSLGASASAALIARGFAELARLGNSLGARPETLMGLSGLGDLILTCNSTASRNFSFGLNLGRGLSVAEASQGKLAEGAHTASALVEMANARHVEMPICTAVNAVLRQDLTIERAIETLLARPSKAE